MALVARYGDWRLPVVDVIQGVPYVCIEGRSQKAAEVVYDGTRLWGITQAPTINPAAPGFVADFHATTDDGEKEIACPVVLWETDPLDRSVSAYVLHEGEVEHVMSLDRPTFRYLGCRPETGSA